MFPTLEKIKAVVFSLLLIIVNLLLQLLHMIIMCSAFIMVIDFVKVLRKYFHATDRLFHT